MLRSTIKMRQNYWEKIDVDLIFDLKIKNKILFIQSYYIHPSLN